MVETNEDIWWALYIIVIFVVFISGLFLGALISPRRRKEREPSHARPIAAKGGFGRDGKVRSANLLAFVIAFVIGMVVLDHFMGPLLPGK
jgi:hypothetical protein